MDYRYHVLDKQEAYRGFFKLDRYQIEFELFRGGMSGTVMRECSATSGYVVAGLAYDRERETFALIEQFRIGAMVAGHHPWQLEIVAGFMDIPGESADDCMQRELEEEIGTRARALHHIQTYFTSPGGSAGQTHLYFAEIDSSQTATHTGLLDEGEDILVHHIPYATAYQWLHEGQIQNATMLLALQAFYIRHQAGDPRLSKTA
ncbi:MAG: NUDIX domain-containing protein [Cardiobacteriaceae bacterium]|nr:NUDIX domain-containing protein [Cardiobacteriaceae bacterium]